MYNIFYLGKMKADNDDSLSEFEGLFMYIEMIIYKNFYIYRKLFIYIMYAANEDRDNDRNKKKRKKYVAQPKIKVTGTVNKVDDKDEMSKKKTKKKRLKFRTSTSCFYNMMNNLSNVQKKHISEIGFESMIEFPISKIPSTLAYYILEKFNAESCVLEVNGEFIKVTKDCVKRTFGIPFGGKKIKSFEESKMNNHITKKWKKQFKRAERISLKHLQNVIQKQKKGGTMFKLNFLVFFITVMVEGSKCNSVNQKFLPSITNEKEIKKMDWCGYVFKCLKKTSKEWKKKVHFNGPIVLLMVSILL